jgi:hypothetical protein
VDRNLDDLARRRRVALGRRRRNTADRVDALDEARVHEPVAAGNSWALKTPRGRRYSRARDAAIRLTAIE